MSMQYHQYRAEYTKEDSDHVPQSGEVTLGSRLSGLFSLHKRGASGLCVL